MENSNVCVTNILGDGIAYVELLDHLGGDLANVNGARASFKTRKQAFDDADARLLNRLSGDCETTPLRHSYFQFYIEAPEICARQWYKHIIGCEYAFKDLPWSEFSQRYKEVPANYYVPKEWRGQSDKNKQASVGAVQNQSGAWRECLDGLEASTNAYQILLNMGVAREQARINIPLAIYTSWVWTASLQAVVHFAALRDHPGAQWETQQFAKALRSLVQPLAPKSWAALEGSHPLTLKAKIAALEARIKELESHPGEAPACEPKGS